MAACREPASETGNNFLNILQTRDSYDSQSADLSNPIVQELVAENIRLKQVLQRCSKLFYENQAKMIFIRLRDNSIMEVNRKTTELSGYSREELVGKKIDVLMDLSEGEEVLSQLSKNGYLENFEYKYKKKSGDIGYALMTGALIELDGEKYLLVSSIDTTNRKKTEESLQLTREVLRKVFSTNPLPTAVVSLSKGTIIEVNDIFLQKLECSREELIGKTVAELGIWVNPNDRNMYLETIKTKGLARNFETQHRLVSGRIVSVLLSGVIINYLGIESVLTVINNINELRSYQQKMANYDRLSLIGEMAAGIAHEIRNPLTVVKGFLQLFKSKERYKEDREHLTLMVKELDRANSIITEYLSLAREKPFCLTSADLNSQIYGLVPLMQPEALKRGICIELELEQIPNIILDTGEIRQLILNLVFNGMEAMGSQGKLTIKTFQEDYEAVLVVQDQGPGMTPEVLAKIGTPFFTTKPNGTGLGLAVCFRIAQRHNARLEVESNQNGTAVKVVFPIEEGIASA